MDNNLPSITQEVTRLTHELFPVVTGKQAEMEILNSITTELTKITMGDPEETKRAMMNMFMVGQELKEKELYESIICDACNGEGGSSMNGEYEPCLQCYK